jgi:hypothetical protein
LSPRKRLVFVLCFVAVVAALAMHRWPLPQAARIDMAEVQQGVEALRQEVEQVCAAPDPADAYTPQTPGSIADLATDAATRLRQLPGVATVEVLVACPKPAHRVIHRRDYHFLRARTMPWTCKPPFDAKKQMSLQRTFRRASCLLTRLTVHLGAAGATPLLTRFSSPVPAAAPEQRRLEEFYLDVSEEWDDPCRFYRW